MAGHLSRRSLAKALSRQLIEGVPAKKVARSAAAFLLDHKMTDQTDMLLGDIAYELAHGNHHLFANVTSARHINQELTSEISTFLRRHYSTKTVEIATHQDPSLLGGIVVNTPTETLDTSVSTKLKRLKRA